MRENPSTLTDIQIDLELTQQRRVYAVRGAPQVEDNLTVSRGVPRLFVPSRLELDTQDDDLVTAWIFSSSDAKRTQGRAAFSNHDAKLPPLTLAPEWVMDLVEQLVPNWKGIDNG